MVSRASRSISSSPPKMTRRSLIVGLMAAALVSTCTVGTGGVPEEEDEPLMERTHRPTECAHLYNVGRSREWQDCMGVGPK